MAEEKIAATDLGPAEIDASRGVEAKVSPWNTLEVAKLIASAGTTLAVFALGYVVTTSNSKQALAREETVRNETINREKQTQAETLAREEKLRKEGVERDDSLRAQASADAKHARNEAFAREKALREEGFARDAALRRASDERDARLRAEAHREARADKLLQTRKEVWSKLNAALENLRQDLGILMDRGETEILTDRDLAKFAESMGAVEREARADSSNFGGDTRTALAEYLKAVREISGFLHVYTIEDRQRNNRSGKVSKAAKEAIKTSLDKVHAQLADAVAQDLQLTAAAVEDSSPRKILPRARNQ